MTVLQLHAPKPCDDIVAGLRKLADDIESGNLEHPVTTCVAVLGHTEAERRSDDETYIQQVHWQVRGWGPRTDTFTVRGLMHSAICNWEGPLDG